MLTPCEELPGPAIAVTPAETIEYGIALADDSKYGSRVRILMRDINCVLRFMREV
jgi:acyl-CoA reductase-like NAD-dependent aldehyde dehydrogenase